MKKKAAVCLAAFYPFSKRQALSVLAYHGVIDFTGSEEPKIAGTLFKEWFLKEFQTIDDRINELSPTSKIRSDQLTRKINQKSSSDLSPLFNLDKIFSESLKDYADLDPEDNYAEIQERKKLEKEIMTDFGDSPIPDEWLR